MHRTLTIFRRELAGYFAAPTTYVFVSLFLALAGGLTFFVGDFFGCDRADLEPFFRFHPWLYLGLAPALSMRLWAAENETGTRELLLTLPVRRVEAVIGKFFAAWCVAAIALSLTSPLWLTVNLLGRPDNDAILAGYGASWLMAGALLAIGEAASAASTSRIGAFIASAAIIFGLITVDGPALLHPLRARVPANVFAAIAGLSLPRHFAALTHGVIELSDLVYFLSLMVGGLAATTIILDLRGAE